MYHISLYIIMIIYLYIYIYILYIYIYIYLLHGDREEWKKLKTQEAALALGSPLLMY